MKMTEKVYFEILNFFSLRQKTEEGGLIGSSRHEIIDYFFPDREATIKTKNIYVPNIVNLNLKIKEWREREIDFCGIIHSHLTNTPELSLADKLYIEKILLASRSNTSLFFPIVLYKNRNVEIIAYRARINKKGCIKYFKEEYQIVRLKY